MNCTYRRNDSRTKIHRRCPLLRVTPYIFCSHTNTVCSHSRFHFGCICCRPLWSLHSDNIYFCLKWFSLSVHFFFAFSSDAFKTRTKRNEAHVVLCVFMCHHFTIVSLLPPLLGCYRRRRHRRCRQCASSQIPKQKFVRECHCSLHLILLRVFFLFFFSPSSFLSSFISK